MKKLAFGFVGLLFLGSCGQQAEQKAPSSAINIDHIAIAGTGKDTPATIAKRYGISESDADRLLNPKSEFDSVYAAFGGKNAFFDFIRTHTDEENRAALKKHGLGYTSVSESELTAQETIADCPKFFSTAVRGALRVGNQVSVIDGSGRPVSAQITLPISTTRYNRVQCQTDVGAWGRAENPSQNYQGGHMIGYALGGWNKRANLAPQEASLNYPFWYRGEAKVARCRAGTYTVDVSYNFFNGSSLVPTRWSALVERTGREDSYIGVGNVAPSASAEAAMTVYLNSLTTNSGCI